MPPAGGGAALETAGWALLNLTAALLHNLPALGAFKSSARESTTRVRLRSPCRLDLCVAHTLLTSRLQLSSSSSRGAPFCHQPARRHSAAAALQADCNAAIASPCASHERLN